MACMACAAAPGLPDQVTQGCKGLSRTRGGAGNAPSSRRATAWPAGRGVRRRGGLFPAADVAHFAREARDGPC